MTRDIHFDKNQRLCVWQGSMLDVALPFSGTKELKNAYPLNSVFVAIREEEKKQEKKLATPVKI